MTLDKLRPLAERGLDPFVGAADRIGLTPDGVSVVAIGFAALAGGAYAVAGTELWGIGPVPTLYPVGAAFVFLNGWMDLVDGALARRQGADSVSGDLLDHVLDRYADIVVIAGLAAGAEAYLLGFLAVTGVLMTSYLGTQAQAVGLDRVYGGLVGRADRLAIIGVVTAISPAVTGPIAGYPPVGWLLGLLAVVGHLTALQRFYASMQALE